MVGYREKHIWEAHLRTLKNWMQEKQVKYFRIEDSLGMDYKMEEENLLRNT